MTRRPFQIPNGIYDEAFMIRNDISAIKSDTKKEPHILKINSIWKNYKHIKATLRGMFTDAKYGVKTTL